MDLIETKKNLRTYLRFFNKNMDQGSILTYYLLLLLLFIIIIIIIVLLSITIYKDDSLFCVYISKYQFYPLKYNYL